MHHVDRKKTILSFRPQILGNLVSIRVLSPKGLGISVCPTSHNLHTTPAYYYHHIQGYDHQNYNKGRALHTCNAPPFHSHARSLSVCQELMVQESRQGLGSFGESHSQATQHFENLMNKKCLLMLFT